MQPSTSTTEYTAGHLESKGIEYQRLLAWFILQRLMLANEKSEGKLAYKMAFEMKEAGKFDDIGVFFNGRWYLFQLKHSVTRTGEQDKHITKGMLFTNVDKTFLI